MHKFVDQTFQAETTGEKILSIQASLNGFSFSIVCPTQKKLLYFKDIALKISNENLLARHFESVFSEETMLQNNFREVYLNYHSQNFTLIPEHIYQKQIENGIMSFLFEENALSAWINNKIPEVKGELLFSIPKNFEQLLNRLLPKLQVIHSLKFLIERTDTSNADPKLLLLFEKNHFSLALFYQNEMKLVNNYSFKHPNDMVYFILTVLRQFAISAKNISTLYGGDTEANNGLLELLQKHFPGATPIQASILVPPFIEKTLISKNISLFL